LPLSRYRARNQMVEIRAEDLSLTESETRDLLKALGAPSMSNTAITLLHQRTEGWAAGLQLSALALQKQPAPEAFVSALSGNQRYIFDFLMDEVLSNLPEEQQDFLLKTSVLRQLSGPVCDVLTGHSNTQALLDQLYQQNIFLHSIDESREWYRYHGLFRDVLQYRLRRAYPAETIKNLHLLASQWYQQAGWGQEALEHALLASDFERAGALLETTTELITWSKGFHTDLIPMFEAFPESVLRSRPRLQLLYARALLLDGREQEAMTSLDHLEKSLKNAAFPEQEKRHYLGMILTHRATQQALLNQADKASSFAHQALDFLPADDLLTRAQAAHTLGLAADAKGQIRKASECYQHASLQAIRANHRTLAVTAASQQAITEIKLGMLHQAEGTIQQALHWATVGSTELPTAAYPHAVLAEIFRQKNQLQLADQEIHWAIHLAEKGMPIVRWNAALIQANICLSQHRLSQAQIVLEQSTNNFQYILPEYFSEITRATLCRVWTAQERPDLVQTWFDSLQGRLSNPSGDFPDHEASLLILCQAQITAGEMKPARQQLQTILGTQAYQEQALIRIETLILLALSAESFASAAAYLREALLLAETQGYRRIFLDQGQLLYALLQTYRQQNQTSNPFVDALLEDFRSEGDVLSSPGSQTASSDLEPLTERERDVLAQIARGASNQEIADRLVVSIHTVKKHAANIFIKLNAGNRTEAVARARALGIL
jgi:LuxR family maltose regulon positive regulatory protein